MPRRTAPVLAALAAVLLLAACDTVPGDPLDSREDLAALLSADGGSAGVSAPLTLPGLVQSAVHRVYTEQGASSARALVSQLRRLQEEARLAQARGDRERVAMLMREVHGEQLSIVLRVFGRGIVDRVITGVELDAARLSRDVAASEAAGRPMPRVTALLAEVERLLAEARAHAAEGSPALSLDAATRAAGRVVAVTGAMLDVRRIPGLHDLFELAVAQLRTTAGPEAVRSALERYEILRRTAEEAVRNGNRVRAHEALAEVRAEQIRIILRVLGAPAAGRLVAAVEAGLAESSAALAEARAAGRNVTRLERMHAVARDMVQRARASFDAGDHAAALEVASHAAGLINSVRLGLAR
jgi:hypothetical protein